MSTKNTKAVAKKAETIKGDNEFIPDNDLNEQNKEENEWEEVDLGSFEVVSLKEEGEVWDGFIVGDCSENHPEWLPEQFDGDKLFETINSNGKKGVIAKWFRIQQAVDKYGFSKNRMFRFTRLKKKGEKQTDFVDFSVASKMVK